jgi:NAD(P)-dependent dehydrogenase (short-subunit alcohol dehydrogenase family)
MMANEILILGSKGLVGRFVSNYLSQKGWLVHGFDLIDGIDFRDEDTLTAIMEEKSKVKYLINAFAIDAKVSADGFGYDSLNLPLKDFTETLNVNVVVTFSSCRSFIATRKGGVIINISSIYGMVSPNPALYRGEEKPIFYGASKSAVIQITRHLAIHYAPTFRVNCLTLGGLLDQQHDDFKVEYAKYCPMNRLGDVEEIRPALDFLLSDFNTYMTGANIIVDGGWTAI